MKSFIIGAIALIAISLGGCNIGGLNVTAPTAAQVLAATQQACAFLPTVSSVEVVLKANPSITDATQLASLICTGLAQVSVTPGGGLEKDVTVVIGNKSYVIHGTLGS